MIEAYGEDLEIYCMTLMQNYDSRCDAAVVEKYNVCIKAIAEFMGATVIDQNGEYSELTADKVHAYSTTFDTNGVHPDSAGHELMERLIVKTMCEKNGIE